MKIKNAIVKQNFVFRSRFGDATDIAYTVVSRAVSYLVDESSTK